MPATERQAALLVIKTELHDGNGFGRSLVRRGDDAEGDSTRSQDRDASRAELGGLALGGVAIPRNGVVTEGTARRLQAWNPAKAFRAKAGFVQPQNYAGRVRRRPLAGDSVSLPGNQHFILRNISIGLRSIITDVSQHDFRARMGGTMPHRAQEQIIACRRAAELLDSLADALERCQCRPSAALVADPHAARQSR